ncbi:RNA-directed DNA polymerase, eukaryota, reverse transcriptase zinc-binding domain protein [Tanacetum coccineum]
MACRTEKAIEWDASWSKNLDPLGRAALGVHNSAYKESVTPIGTVNLAPNIIDNMPRMMDISAPEHQSRLSSIDAKIDLGNVSKEDIFQQRESIKILGDIKLLEAKDIAQKVKVKWAIEADSNILMAFLHLWMAICLIVLPEFLENQFSLVEIKRAVWDCGGDRAPGPDGFTFKFITTFWDLIEEDVIRFFVSDFRPISIIGCQYKIIGKLLTNMLSNVIGSCIIPEQSTFIKGRNILDGPFIINEVMAWYHKRKKALMVFKVDFEKAFDSLRWEFLELVMDKLEGLHVLTYKAESLGLFKGASLGNDNMNISHLIYADDVIFLGEWCWSFYEEVSNMAHAIGCGAVKLPMKYLGVLLDATWPDSPIGMISFISSLLNFLFGKPAFYLLEAGFPLLSQFLCNSPDLWVRVIKNLYGAHGGIMEDSISSSCHSLWSGILSAIKRLKLRGIDLLSLCNKKTENGVSCRFKEDTWCGDQPFKTKFPRIYELEIVKDCSITDCIPIHDWVNIFRRQPRGGAEMSQFNDLLSLIQGVPLSDKSDSWLWSLDISNGYTVASRLMLNKLPSRVNLDKRGIDVGLLLCPICMDDIENVNHIFFSCNMAKDLLSLFAKWWEIDIPVCVNISEWFNWLDDIRISLKFSSQEVDALGPHRRTLVLVDFI